MTKAEEGGMKISFNKAKGGGLAVTFMNFSPPRAAGASARGAPSSCDGLTDDFIDMMK
eukprot:CAMPEP_0119314126 /NCGR_PEP_ID=MMETSP1333-20130426/31789_1 /TAXON_ID=418940 /ORGANISM="Scyphosphaera apsteinii, Strain RCC1455" /LENGTH=57 /DNA_ID=CAMNT_0007319179 /DNA_START=926 /DNA_END=1096 /DNA_ORIENTATION=+